MNTNARLLPQLVYLIGQVISIDFELASITETTSLAADLMIDSISLVSLVALSEERFGIDLSGHIDAIVDIETVGDALAVIAAARVSAVAV